MEAFDQTEFWN
jgi:2-polyprenyl-3-methyl-5-hydroxy-6-metoxy-1,4-benzoquinol methylase